MAEDRRQATEARLSALEKVRALLEEARVHARKVGGLEGVRIDAQLTAPFIAAAPERRSRS
jgi:hypothetical protein